MNRLSQKVDDLHSSPIREILSVIEKPGMTSFAGGLPAPESFPDLRLDNIPASLLQYGCSEGEWALREEMRGQLAALGLECDTDQILIISGSQQGIDLTAKLFVDKGTPVAVESPTYLAALQVFDFFGARYTGFIPGSRPARSAAPRLLYSIPTFQNPTGYCYSEEERQSLADYCDRENIPLFEDDPYRELYYEPCSRTPVCSLVRKASWIYQGSFSKAFAPGLRLGYLVCSRDLLPHFVRLKQASDLHSCRLSQHLVLELLRSRQGEERMKSLRERYKTRRDHFQACLEQYLSDCCDWTLPKGGLFFWLRLREALDTDQLLQEAIRQNVAFMPGKHFFTAEPESAYLRLNFSHASPEAVEQGIKTLSHLLKAHNDRLPKNSAA